MKKSYKAYIVFFTYFILMISDGLLTLYNTPDLSLEGNPLVTKLHLGWGALITVNAIFMIVIFICCKYTFEKYQTINAEVPDLKSYISQIFYNRPDKFIWTLYKLPKNRKPVMGWFCYVLVYSLITGAVVRIFEWLMFTFDIHISIYNKIDNLFFGRFDIFVGISTMILLSYVWFKKEFNKSKSAAAVTMEE